jgi:hypothetical protein
LLLLLVSHYATVYYHELPNNINSILCKAKLKFANLDSW